MYCARWKKHPTQLGLNPHKSPSSWLVVLLIIAGDIQPNPDPRPPKYPCSICNKAVRYGQEGIQCDQCDIWHHRGCMQMCAPNYIALQNSDISWLCHIYGMPNFSSNLFVGSIEEIHNSFASLPTPAQIPWRTLTYRIN